MISDVLNGGIAQLGERLHGMQEVMGSNPTISICDWKGFCKKQRSFLLHRKLLWSLLCNKKPSGQDRTAAERNDAAKAARRRRRILRCRILRL